VTDRPNGSAVPLVYEKCRSADSDSSFLIVASADADADSPAPIEWGWGERHAGSSLGFVVMYSFPRFLYERRRCRVSLSLSLFIFSESVRSGVLIEL
jgi:hypothetical protein